MATATDPRDVRLSDLDHLMPCVGNDYVWVFATPHVATAAEWTELHAALRRSFEEHVGSAPLRHATGLPQRTDAAGGHRIWLRDVGTAPPLWIVNDIDGWAPPSADLLTGHMASWPLSDLYPTAAESEGAHRRPLKVKLTWCRGSSESAVVMAVQAHHWVLDAASVITIVNTWAARHRGDTAAATKLFSDRTLLNGTVSNTPRTEAFATDVAAAAYEPFAEEGPMFPPSGPGVVARFAFSAVALDCMRQKCAPFLAALGAEGTRLSTNDLVCASIWRCFVAVGHNDVDLDAPTAMLIPTNVRGRAMVHRAPADAAAVPLADEYIGNCVLPIADRRPSARAFLAEGALSDDPRDAEGLCRAALSIHREVQSRITADYIADWQDHLARDGVHCSGFSLVPCAPPFVLVSNWSRFDAVGANFGDTSLGTPVFFSPGLPCVVPGFGYIVAPQPARSASGGVDLIMAFASAAERDAVARCPAFGGIHVGDVLAVPRSA